MKFDTDYWSSFDEEAKKIQLDPREIGISHGIGELGEGLKANIFRGASVIELGFMGQGKGFRSQPTGGTPESYGRSEREELRDLARINEVQLSTHASPNLGSPSGFSREGFSDEHRQQIVHELKRTIEFAADTAGGGAIVLHTGEFPRSITEVDEKFEAYPEEKKKAPIYFVDNTTGTVQAIRRDLPVIIPSINEKTGKIDFETKTYNQIAEEAKKEGKDPIKEFFNKYTAREIEINKARESEYLEGMKRAEESLKELKNLQQGYEAIKETRGEEAARINLAKTLERQTKGLETEHPEEYLKEAIKHQEQAVTYHREGAFGHGSSVKEIENRNQRVELINNYGVEQSAKTISEAALYAYEVEKKRELDRPLFIAPENFLPEMYGGHPDEYRNLIQKSREAMAEKLEAQGKDEAEAKKIAENHIKGTFDIGHFNFWRKYFTGKPEEFDHWVSDQVSSLVRDGIIGHVHLSDNFGYHDEHLSPGEGNAPIQKFLENLKEEGFKGKIIAEPGGQKQSDIPRVWLDSMRAAGSPAYRIDAISRSWTDIDQSYFGRTQNPNFIVGDYAPSKDWTLWSETPLE